MKNKNIKEINNNSFKSDWNSIFTKYSKTEFSISEYHKILCSDIPSFLDKYIELPLLKRLDGIGLLCGSDWTPLFNNRFFYSRLDHSIGVALIVWNFTHDKTQTIAGLLHDISTPVFSHVSDFRKGDALKQEVTEEQTEIMIRTDESLELLLREDEISIEDVIDYHKYPIADNDIPRLSADRLEYMFPSGAVLDGSWNLEEIKEVYNDICILINEDGFSELGFKSIETAEKYTEKFCDIGHILQLNEDKLTLHLLGDILNKAIKLGIFTEKDFMTSSEEFIIKTFDRLCTLDLVTCGKPVKKLVNLDIVRLQEYQEFIQLLKTFRSMKEVIHSDLPLNGYYCVSIRVKQRYINPLVALNGGIARRLSTISDKARNIIDEFCDFEDTKYGCVKLVENM